MNRLDFFFKKDNYKEYNLNKILDKITKKETLSKIDQKFLENYNLDYIKDYLYLSKSDFLTNIKYLLDKKDIFCDIYNYEDKVVDIINNKNKNFLLLKNTLKYEVKDKYLYHINYIYKQDYFSLTESDEFYEKIENNDN